MATTRKTLLARAKDPADGEAWSAFYELYAPLLYRYARARHLSAGDAEEIRDQCLALVAQKLPQFDYDRSKGSFKNWLYRIAAGRIVDHRRALRARRAETGELEAVPDPSPSPDERWEESWRQEHLRYGLERAVDCVPERSYRAFQLLLMEGRTVPEVAEELGINANQVYKAKSLVLKRVREIVARLGTE